MQIIHRARRNYLLEKYIEKQNSAEIVMTDVEQSLVPYMDKMEKTTDEDKKNMLVKIVTQVHTSEGRLKKALSGGSDEEVQNAVKVRHGIKSDNYNNKMAFV